MHFSFFSHRRLPVVCFAATLAAGCALSVAQAADLKNRNPTSKLFVTDVEGGARIESDNKIQDLIKKSVHAADGVVIETKKSADPTNKDKDYSSMVYSNGTGIYFDTDTRLEVKKFIQEPFLPNRTDMETEPSVSQTQSYLARGLVGLCTSKMVAGSSMVYETPLGSVNIRGRKILIESTDKFTRVAMIEGDSTVRGGSGSGLEMGGQTLHTGEQAFIRPGAAGEPPSVSIEKISESELSAMDDKVSMACLAKKTVYFDTVDRAGDPALASTFAGPQEIVPVEVVPVDLPVQFTVSPAKL